MNSFTLLALLGAIFAVVSSASMNKRRATYPFEQIDDKGLYSPSQDLEIFNKMVLRLIDAAIEDAKERGSSDVILQDMMHKRGKIQRCFFHAVNCW